MSSGAFNQMRKFQVAAARLRGILDDHRRAGVGFELAWRRALGSLTRTEERNWLSLFKEYRADWEDAYHRRPHVTDREEAEDESVSVYAAA